MEVFWVFLIGGGILALSLYAHHRRKMNAIADGHATDRDKVFFRQQHRFTTGVASIAEVAAALDMNVLTERKVSVDKTSEAHAIIFRNGGMGAFAPFVSVLERNGTEGDKFRYNYQIESSQTTSSGGDDVISANIILTQVEKAFLRLDSSTEVERIAVKYKTKTKWF
ncbi:MAG: hypothetical protein FWE83_06565 [Oscillospiraceae bacterium]|nr:hypothetical protein [Oscillospiraceae bacterium]